MARTMAEAVGEKVVKSSSANHIASGNVHLGSIDPRLDGRISSGLGVSNEVPDFPRGK